MDKVKILILSVFVFAISAFSLAQENNTIQNQVITIAYVNSAELLDGLKEKEKATEQLINLSENYKKELEIMQKEYNKKYSDYITYQNSLADNIKLRRMQELTELESKIEQFIKLGQDDIEQQEQLLLQPLKDRINNAIRQVGLENNYTIIYDLSDSGIAFITPAAIDANLQVKQKLGQ